MWIRLAPAWFMTPNPSACAPGIRAGAHPRDVQIWDEVTNASIHSRKSMMSVRLSSPFRSCRITLGVAFRAGMPRAAFWFTARAGGKENRPLAAGSADLLLALRSVPASSHTGRCALSAGVCSMFLLWPEGSGLGPLRSDEIRYNASYQEIPKMKERRTRGKSTRIINLVLQGA